MIKLQNNIQKELTNKRWSEEEIIFLKENFQNLTHYEIAKVVKRTESAVRAKCFELNLYKKELPWNDYEIDFLKENYKEMNTADIAKTLKRTKNAVKIKAEKIGLKKYSYTCDYHYFEEINTEEKAYWLGFLSADGWINKNENTNSGVTGIELQYNDINHLKKFNKSISGNYKITDRWRSCSISNNKNKKNHFCCIRIFSIIMYESLVKLGFTNNKSYDCYIPELPDNLIRHYIRGYFDGNGCFTLTNKTFKVSFITASSEFSKDLLSIFGKINININCQFYISEYNTPMYIPSIDKFEDKIKFLDWIYEDSSIYLDRKYKKYLKMKERYGTT